MGKINNSFLYLYSRVIKLVSGSELLILNYHRVLNSEELYFSSDIDTNTFSWHMKLVKDYLNPLPLTDAVTLLYKNRLPKGAVVVTFDDGYRDNFENALPILKSQSIPATFFVASAFLNGGIMWNDVIIESIRQTEKTKIDCNSLGMGGYDLNSRKDRIKAIESIINKVKYKNLIERKTLIEQINQLCDVKLPVNLMMNDDDIVQLHQAGMEIGGHTSNHPIFKDETDNVVMDEVLEGKGYLEKLLNTKLISFAYPNGKLDIDYEVKHVDIVKKAGFELAVSTDWGLNTRLDNPYQLKRFTPWDKTPNTFLLRLCRLFLFKSA